MNRKSFLGWIIAALGALPFSSRKAKAATEVFSDQKLLGNFKIQVVQGPDYYRAIFTRDDGMHTAVQTFVRDLTDQQGRRAALNDLTSAMPHVIRQHLFPTDALYAKVAPDGLEFAGYPEQTQLR